MHLFYDHVTDILNENVQHILVKNTEDKAKLKNVKNVKLDNIQSYYASDIYRSSFHVIELLSGDIKGGLLNQIVKVYLIYFIILIFYFVY
jgi:hypothetical protein